METRFYNGIRGAGAESYTEPDTTGNLWHITTYKAQGGIICSAVQGSLVGDCFTHTPHDCNRMKLATRPGRCTEKAIREVHAEGLAKFAEQQEKEPAPAPYVIQVGQILFTDGYGQDSEKRRAVCEITGPGQYKCVLLDGSEFKHDTHVRSYSKKYGIGVYYREGDTIAPQEVAQLVERATAATQERNEATKRAKDKAEADRKAKIEAGATILPALPEWAKAVIVAELHKNESDLMTDYHGRSTTKTVYLAFSPHTRDLFPEMRKAADLFEETAHLGTGKGLFQAYQINTSETDFELCGLRQFAKCGLKNGNASPYFSTREQAEKWITQQTAAGYVIADDQRKIELVWHIEEESIEHREKYSMGSGYYLKDGYSNSTGWAVSKCNLAPHMLETLQIAAAEGRFFCPMEEEKTAAPQYEPVEVPAGSVAIVDYSEKAVAVVGETKPIKDKLKALGGSFNARLSCGPGWIFPKAKYQVLVASLSASPTSISA